MQDAAAAERLAAANAFRGLGAGTPVRIAVPTSQIFQGVADTLGTDDFAPTYARRDVSDRFEIPADLARFFVARARRHGGMPLAEAQTARNRRALAAARDP